MMKSILQVLKSAIVPVVLLSMSASAYGEGPGMTEMRVAEQHAGLAAQSRDLQEVKTQLQQALNCLVGRNSKEFRGEAGDPCKGESALRKLPQGSANHVRVQKAIRLASVGVTFHDFKPAHYTAEAVQAVLQEGVH